jgi:hypothetical protein
LEIDMTALTQTSPARLATPSTRPGFGLANILAYLVLLYEVFGEAQDMARAAQKRYPFMEL